MRLLGLLLAATAGAAAQTASNNGTFGAALYWPNSTCPAGTYYSGAGWQANCCPDGTFSATSRPGYCCPTNASCFDTLVAYPRCADAAWSYFPATNFAIGFCCLPGWIGYAQTNADDGADGDQFGDACAPPGFYPDTAQETIGSASQAPVVIASSTTAGPSSTSTAATTTTTSFNLSFSGTTSSASSSATAATATGSNSTLASPLTQNSSSSSTSVGVIAGAVVAGAIGAGVLILSVLFILRRRRQRAAAKLAAADEASEDARAEKPELRVEVEAIAPPTEMGVPDSPRELADGEVHELPAGFTGYEMPPGEDEEDWERRRPGGT